MSCIFSNLTAYRVVLYTIIPTRRSTNQQQQKTKQPYHQQQKQARDNVLKNVE